MQHAAARYVSTRGSSPVADFAEALLRGMAPDGGLYMPTQWPRLTSANWAAGLAYSDMALAAMQPFIGTALPEGALDRALGRLIAGFAPPEVTPLVQLEDGLWLLELFHGPTAAFKDDVPYTIALVDLDEGFRMMLNVLDSPPAELAIGSRVRIVYRPHGEAMLPQAELTA